MRIAGRIASSFVFVFLMACASAPPPVDSSLPEWTSLRDGNAGFRTGTITFTGLRQQYPRQTPPITVLACIDSRVPPELVFRQSVNRLFDVRSAGNVVDALGLASLEYAITRPDTKMLVILAHEHCGAVEEAIKTQPSQDVEVTSLEALMRKIRESFVGPSCTLADPACLPRRIRENALYTVGDLKRRSTILKKAIEEDHLPVAVLHYQLDGHVTLWQNINFTP
jgi:carbonic anhydrase